jgi:hypothetical protein
VTLTDDHSEVLDGEPTLALDVVAGVPSGLSVERAAELAELLEDAERYAAAAQSITRHARIPATGLSSPPGVSGTRLSRLEPEIGSGETRWTAVFRQPRPRPNGSFLPTWRRGLLSQFWLAW